jgi:hypothetical protein
MGRLITAGRFRPGILISLAVVAAVYLLTLAMIDRRGFWVLDNASKYVQMRSIEESGYHNYWIPVPGRVMDPELRLNPVPFPFAVYADGNLFPVFSPVFAVLSSIPHRLFGMDGLYLFPFVCTLLALLGVGKIVERVAGRRDPGDRSPQLAVISVLAAGLCTPLWFYSAVFWEHAIAVCLCVWGVYFHLSFLGGRKLRDLITGSALCAVAVWFRDELYLFILVLVLNHLRVIRREGWRAMIRVIAVAGATSIVFFLPLWLFQWWAIGRPFGFHLETHTLKTTGIGAFLSMRPRVLYNLLLAAHESIPVSILLSVPFLFAFIVRPKLPWRVFRVALPLAGLLAVLGTLVTLSGYRGPDGPILALDRSNGLFACVPILALGFMRLGDGRKGSAEPAEIRWIHVLAASYAVVYVVFAHGLGSKGIHWGNRFLLVLYPLLVILAASNVGLWIAGLRGERADQVGAGRRPAPLAWALALVAVVSFGAQCLSINLLSRVTDFSDRLSSAIEARPEAVILTDTFWLPEFIHREFLKKEIFLVRSEEMMRYFRGRFQAAGGGRYLYLTARPDPPSVEPDLTVDDRGLKYYTVRGYEQSVGSGR